jgi:hypothetical protein
LFVQQSNKRLAIYSQYIQVTLYNNLVIIGDPILILKVHCTAFLKYRPL